MGYAAAMTWEMDGFRLVRSRPRAGGGFIGPVSQTGFRPSGFASADGSRRATAAGLRTGGLPGQAATGLVRGAERGLEVDWQIVVQRCLDGDSGAWGELVKGHYGACMRFVTALPDRLDRRRGPYSDVFLKVYGNLSAFDLSRGSFQTWITTLTRNLLVTISAVPAAAVHRLDGRGWADGRPYAGHSAGGFGGPTQHDKRRAERNCPMVQEALTRISPELREAVILKRFAGHGLQGDRAEILRIPEGQ